MADVSYGFPPISDIVGAIQGGNPQPLVQLLLVLWNRTGFAPGVATDELQLLQALENARGTQPARDGPAAIDALLSRAPAPRITDDISVAALLFAISARRSSTTTGATVIADTVTAAEALSAGNVCNLFDSSGVAKAQKANATDLTKPANCFVLAPFASNAIATIYLPGQWITGLTSLSPGATYWLSTTGGAITTTPPSTSGNGDQMVGWADSTGTKLFFFPTPIVGV